MKGARAVVTGSTRGIGFAIAEALLSEGVQVVISARSEPAIQTAINSLQGTGRVFGKPCDVRNPEQVQQLIRFCVEKLGGIDILVNNAGVGLFKTVEEMTPLQWRNTIATNLDGVFYGCHFAVPEMKRGQGGFIINISSLAGKNAFPGGAAYNASKFALTGFSGSKSVGNGSWKISPRDIAEVVLDTLRRHPRSI